MLQVGTYRTSYAFVLVDGEKISTERNLIKHIIGWKITLKQLNLKKIINKIRYTFVFVMQLKFTTFSFSTHYC